MTRLEVILRFVAVAVLIGLAGGVTQEAKADAWTGPDKTLHFVAGFGVASAVTLATDDPTRGFTAGVVVGVVKELYDTQHRDKHTPSLKDLLVTIAGSGAGALTTGWVIRKDFIGYQLSF